MLSTIYSINGARLLFGIERYCLWLCTTVATGFPVFMAVSLLTWAYLTAVLEILPNYSGSWRSINTMLLTVMYFLCIYTFIMVIKIGGGSPLDIPGFVVRDDNDYGGAFKSPNNDNYSSNSQFVNSRNNETELSNLNNLTTSSNNSGNNRTEDEEQDALLALHEPPRVLNNVTAKENGQMRFCRKCSCWKPDRTHHCRTCRRCVLRMDHHCPWFATCIGYKNMKLFVLFLIYVVIFCAICFICTFTTVFAFFRDETYEHEYMSLNVLFLCLVSGIFGITLFGFSGFAFYNVLSNKTTLEVLEGIRFKTAVANSTFRFNDAPSSKTVGNVFDIGRMHNFCEVFGSNHWLWFLPIANPLGNGISFPINREVWEDVQQIVQDELHAVALDREFNERTRQEREQYISRMA